MWQQQKKNNHETKVVNFVDLQLQRFDDSVVNDNNDVIIGNDDVVDADVSDGIDKMFRFFRQLNKIFLDIAFTQH